MIHFPMSAASYSFHGLSGEGKCDVFHYLAMLRSRSSKLSREVTSDEIENLSESKALEIPNLAL